MRRGIQHRGTCRSDPRDIRQRGLARGIDSYAQASAARAIPLGAALLFSLASRRKRALLPLLTISGAVQLGDVAIGVAQGIPGMMVAGSVLALIHLATARQLALGRSRSAAVAA